MQDKAFTSYSFTFRTIAQYITESNLKISILPQTETLFQVLPIFALFEGEDYI